MTDWEKRQKLYEEGRDRLFSHVAKINKLERQRRWTGYALFWLMIFTISFLLFFITIMECK